MIEWIDAGNNLKKSVILWFEPLTNTGKSLTWANKLKALKSAWYNLCNKCDEQQFYITKMMILILSVIVMYLYLYPVCPSLKERIFQGTPFSGCFQILHLRYGKQDLGTYTMLNV